VIEIEPNQQLSIRREELKSFFSETAAMSRDCREALEGLDAQRVDSVIPATALLLSVMKTFDVQELRYCPSALREGILVEHIATNRAHLLARAAWPDPRTRSVLQLAERCGYRQSHAEQVARLAVQLFEQLRTVHLLEDGYRDLLRSACILHDIGYMISQQNHHKHSYYLIRNGGLQGFSEQEIEVIANIARYHRKGRPRKSHYSYAQLCKRHRPAVGKLSVLLRLANALDRTHYAAVDNVTCRIESDKIEVLVHTDKDAELELWTARKQGRWLRRAFDRDLEVTLAPQGIEEVAS
jgi:exopolyphosphatase/guanosine-5'-triphosphate,3'-diphosphate pyrophosphatase